MNFNVIYEDDDFLVCNKPNDLLTHHSYFARNIRETSLTQMVRAHVGAKVHPIHRLDRKTSGCILFGKSPESTELLQSLMIESRIKKEYVALVRGHILAAGKIDSPLKNETNGLYQDALTEFEPIELIEYDQPVKPYPQSRYSLIKLRPITGRTHQLRKHMNKIAHPIIGDPKHGNRHHNHAFEDWFRHSHLFLHARSLEIDFPNKEKLIIKADFPAFWDVNCEDLGFKTTLKLL